MVVSRFDFVDVVIADRNLVVTSADEHVCRLEPLESDLVWYCDLDDGTPTGESDPSSFVRWVCPALRTGPSVTGTPVPLLDVRRAGPQSDLGALVKRLGRLAGRVPRGAPRGDAEGRFVYTDPAGILDVALRRRVESWPPARHGDGVVRPAELWSVKRTGEGLVVESVSWWGSAQALDHQIGLAVDIAHRLSAQRRSPTA
ncbi:MAG: hypothetical protein M3Y71_10940 [Actinomycetota bacterium]|nr:hypothetical protein [Actinomycetota bacterium]